jgi:hypothetical protein
MNVRELAEADLRYTLENTNASGTPYTLIDLEGKEYNVTGTVGDIGILFEPIAGEMIRNRSIVCTCRIRTLSTQTQSIPERGWKAIVKDLHDKETYLFVSGNDPDRTLGIYRLSMELDLEEHSG